METADPANFRYMNRIISAACSDSSSSDWSGEYAPRLTARPPPPPSDDPVVASLVADLYSPFLDSRRRAAMELRLLAKHDGDNRLRIARAGAVFPLVALVSQRDPELQEHGVTAVLNLCLHSENCGPVAAAGAIRRLARAVRGPATAATRENAACALLRLARAGDQHREAIGRSGAIPALVELLETGRPRAKKDAATALYAICGEGDRDNKARAVEAGLVRVLLEMMADQESGMVDKAAYVLAAVVGEAKAKVVEEGGVAVLVEMLEVGTQRQKEVATDVLLEICKEGPHEYRAAVAREGVIPPLVALTQTASSKSKKKAEALIEILRRPRAGRGQAV